MNNNRKIGPPKWGIALCAIAAIFGFGAVVMFLWNAILPEVLQVSSINYWQAIGILILSKILFGGIGGGGGKNCGGTSRKWKDRFRQLSDEEKEDFKDAWYQRCNRK